jgi:hypothetical protein
LQQHAGFDGGKGYGYICSDGQFGRAVVGIQAGGQINGQNRAPGSIYQFNPGGNRFSRNSLDASAKKTINNQSFPIQIFCSQFRMGRLLQALRQTLKSCHRIALKLFRLYG